MRSILTRNGSKGAAATLRIVCAGMLCGALAAPLAIGNPAQAAEAFAARAQPRFLSLGVDTANGREGPSRDHRIVWIYKKRGLPLKIVQEWQRWRKVEDPFGDQTWVLASTLQRQRTVYFMGDDGQDVALRARPDINAPVRAEVARGVVAELHSCSRGWCEVKADGVKGWAPRRALWGADSAVNGR